MGFRDTARSSAALVGAVLAAALLSPLVASSQGHPTGGGDAGTADAGAADASTAPRVEPPAALHPPTVVYPSGADGRRVDVELVLTLSEQGAVTGVEVLGHVPADAAEAFDHVATSAARAMTFRPARRDGVPIPVRLRYHMAISPPVVASDAGASADGAVVPELGELGTGDEGVGHAHSHADAAAPDAAVADAATADAAPVDAATVDAAVPDASVVAAPAAPVEEATIRTHSPPPSRGASDVFVSLGPGLRQVPRTNASDLLRLAPGILLTNEGGEGHAEQVYLRGFDAHEGQDLEFTVNGVPVNEAGNPHGEGLVDTHFIIPELVRSIRVLEGPFDPHQGNYAVAGSAEYELGLDQRALSLQYSGGSFNTHRLLALWAPEGGRPGTFAGADVRTTDGFGPSRAARLGRAMAQWESALSATSTLRLLASTYATQYSSAGVLRQDDLDAGRVDFFGTYDPTQGGDAARHTASATLEDATPERTARLQLFGTLRSFRLRENYTGFLEDPPEAYRSGVAQRGDQVDQTESATTVGARGSLRQRAAWRGLAQAIEAGFYGRFDRVDSAQQRLRFGSVVPYRRDFDLGDAITNVGLYVDAELRPWRWLVLRGGVRGDYFAYDVLSRCDLHDATLTSAAPVLDALCYERDRTGPRDPTARRSASGLAIQPRATLLVGPFKGVTFTASVGTGARAADPSYLADSSFAPFVRLVAGEAGAVYNREFGATSLTLRALYYYTAVDRDLIFNQQEGRNTLSPGTVRQGAVLAGRLTNPWLDVVASVTYADSRFVREAADPGSTYFPVDQGDRVPYAPPLVARLDAGVHGPLPLRVRGSALAGRAGLGVTYVAPRPLPFGERSDAIFVVDASAGVRWRWVEVGVSAQNLLNTRYQLGVYNYVSNFNQTSATPDLLPVRHFTAGPPLAVLGTLTLYFGGATAPAAAAQGAP